MSSIGENPVRVMLSKSEVFAMQEKFSRAAVGYLSELGGCFIAAVGLVNFSVAADIPLIGFSGLAYIVNMLFAVPIGMALIILNIPVAILSYRRLGRRFFLHSMLCMLANSLMIDYLAPLFPVYSGSRILAAVAGGALMGIGYSLIYLQNSSTGGSDFVIMLVKSHRPHLQVGMISFVFDFAVIVTIGLLHRDIDGVIYGLITCFITSSVIDKSVIGINVGKLVFIVTDRGREICAAIDRACGRGSTLIRAFGGYTNERRDIVLCACNTKQFFALRQAVKEEDPDSFVVVVNSSEVFGDGFKMLQLGDSGK